MGERGSDRHWAADALRDAHMGDTDHGADIPRPGKPKRGQKIAHLNPLEALRLVIYRALRERRLEPAA